MKVSRVGRQMECSRFTDRDLFKIDQQLRDWYPEISWFLNFDDRCLTLQELDLTKNTKLNARDGY